jgi:hypothetical protein
MGSPLNDVVKDYAELASTLLERWTEHASKVASKLDDGTYDADGAVADLVTTASLATESGFMLAAQVLDAAALLSGSQHKRHVVATTPFASSLAGATLALAGPLVSGHGAQLPVHVITLEPSQLEPGETEFSLSADATSCRGGTYVGAVEASASGKVERILVWIIVP